MTGKRVALYARKSPTIDKSIKDGIDAQLADCRDYANKNNYNIVADFADTNAKGDLLDLPELNAMLELCSSQDIDFVIVRELDRLARDSFKFASIKRELLDYDTKIKFVLQDFDDTEEGQLQEDILAAIAAYEKKKLARRVKRGRQQKLQNGHVFIGSARPFGYEPVEQNGIRTLAIIESEAEIVRMIFEDYIKGDSYLTIAKKLTALGIPTMSDRKQNLGGKNNMKKIRGYGEWDSAIVGKIINSRLYIGEWQYGKVRKNKRGTRTIYRNINEYPTVNVPAIISQETYDLAQEAKSKHVANQKRRTKHEYLLAKRVTCDHCQSAMIGNSSSYKLKDGTKKHYRYYKCFASKPNRRPFLCDNKHNYQVKIIDEIAWQFVLDLFASPENLNKRLLDVYNHKQDNTSINRLKKHVQNAEKFIAEKKTELANLIDTMILMPTEDTKKQVAEQVKSCEQALNELRKKHSELSKELKEKEANQLTLPKIKNLVELAKVSSEELCYCNKFDDRRQLIIDLDVKAKLFYQDGKQFVEISCIVPDSEKTLCLESMSAYRHRSYTQLIRLSATFELTKTDYIEIAA